jgi:hypothetical protein
LLGASLGRDAKCLDRAPGQRCRLVILRCVLERLLTRQRLGQVPIHRTLVTHASERQAVSD